MFKAITYVLRENFTNLFRIISIAKYTVLSDMRESRLGWFWNFANPTIQVLTYWFMFGYVFGRNDVDGIPYISWMLGGMIMWFYLSPCITDGCNAIYKRLNIITRMKFPVSILPTAVVFSKLFDHLCISIVFFIMQFAMGNYPSLYWLEAIYFLFCAIIFCVSFSMLTAVLNMLARDTRKLVLACMRMLLYLSAILWNIERLDGTRIQLVIKANPIFYCVQGYRDAFFYHEGIASLAYSGAWFWGITIGLFIVGSMMMYKFKTRFIDFL